MLPRFAKSEKPLCGMAVDLNSIPLCTRQGFRRYRTSREWLRAKLGPMILSYFALDLLSVLMMKDPYFVLGPEYINATTTSSSAPLSLPPLLANLPTPLLFLYRSLVCCAAILLAIDLIMTCYQLFAHLALRRLLGTRSELWHFPCTNGSFTYSVLDKGMAGFWGSWWHQTFRVAFSKSFRKQTIPILGRFGARTPILLRLWGSTNPRKLLDYAEDCLRLPLSPLLRRCHAVLTREQVHRAYG